VLGKEFMAVVTISRQFGAGGRTLAERLCERFGFHLVDEYAIDEMARKAKMSGDWLTAVEKEASSTILGLISSLVSQGLYYKTPAVPGEGFDRQKYIAFLKKVMTPLADAGGYVLLGRGSQLILKDHPKALHLLLVGEYEDRVRFMMTRHGLSRDEAEKMIKDKRKERAAVASVIFGENIDDHTLYHLVLNTSRVPFDWAVDLAADLLARFMKDVGGR
jgi:cytidylate kinase